MGTQLLSKLNFFWRLTITGLAFTSFGLGGVFLSIFVFPLVILLTRDEKIRRIRIRKIISESFKVFFQGLHHFGVFNYKVCHPEIFSNDQGCMVVANHPSLLDVVSLISIYPNASCIVKKELWTNPFLKGVVKAAGYIPNVEPENLLKECHKAVDRGDVLIVFPEGTRTKPGQKMKLQRGAAHIALRLKCPIRVFQISVNPSTLTKQEPWYSIPSRKADFIVKPKELIQTNTYIYSGTPHSLGARRLTREIQSQIDFSRSHT